MERRNKGSTSESVFRVLDAKEKCSLRKRKRKEQIVEVEKENGVCYAEHRTPVKAIDRTKNSAHVRPSFMNYFKV